MTQVLVVCGVGGAGKTTSSAVVALHHALAGKRVVLMTIDPARRLADALGLAGLGNEAVRIALPEGTRGTLDALMLDRKASWDELVTSQAPDPHTAARLLANPYYRAVSERLSGGHEYMANEKLHQLATSGRWDLVVVDTPPSRHALEFLRATDRIQRILDERLTGALLRPSSGIVGLATRGIVDAVRRLAGDQMLDDLSGFFDLVRGLADGLRRRADEVGQLIRSPATRFMLTLSARAPQSDEVDDFLVALRAERIQFGGFLINRWESLSFHLPPVDPPAPSDADPAAWAATMATLRRDASARLERAAADQRLAQRLHQRYDRPVWSLPDRPTGAADVPALLDLAHSLQVVLGASQSL